MSAVYGVDVDPTSDANSHYFTAEPTSTSRLNVIELVLPDVYLSLTTDSGVFSASRIDSGTRYLLQEHPPIDPATSNILDLGCGYGPIGLAAAIRAPSAQIWGLDVNTRALQLARHNAVSNSISNVVFTTATGIPPDIEFDLIISNPPIRIGKGALHELLRTWLERLTPDGKAWLVVQKHLGSDSLATWLTSQGWTTDRLGSRKGFRLLEVSAKRAQT